MSKSWKLSPSDFAFLWEECPRCFYLKVVMGFYRPRPIMPKIFTQIDLEMKGFYTGRRTESIAPGMPPGVVSHDERWVQSRPIDFPEHSASCFIRGKFDTIVRFDDGGYGVVDFKTSRRKAEHVPLYSRQLHAYAYALENAAAGEFSLSPVKRLGLLVFEPEIYTQGKTGRVGFAGRMDWIEIPQNDAEFKAFLGDVMNVLASPEPPPPGVECAWCRYREESRRRDL